MPYSEQDGKGSEGEINNFHYRIVALFLNSQTTERSQEHFIITNFF